MANTLSYYDLRNFAATVEARTLLIAESGGNALEAIAQSIRGTTLVHESEHSGYRDGVFSEVWLSEQLGMAEPSLPPHWRH